MDSAFYRTLAEALKQIDGGADPERVIARFPDQAEALRRHLGLWQELGATPRAEADAAAIARGRQAMLSAVAAQDGGQPMIPAILSSSLLKAAAMATGVLLLLGSAAGVSAALGGPDVAGGSLRVMGVAENGQDDGDAHDSDDACVADATPEASPAPSPEATPEADDDCVNVGDGANGDVDDEDVGDDNSGPSDNSGPGSTDEGDDCGASSEQPEVTPLDDECDDNSGPGDVEDNDVDDEDNSGPGGGGEAEDHEDSSPADKSPEADGQSDDNSGPDSGDHEGSDDDGQDDDSGQDSGHGTDAPGDKESNDD